MATCALSDRMEAYCQARADKENTRMDCYKIAYPKALKWKENSVSCEAAKLERDPRIIQRIAELKGKLAEKTMWSREKSVKILAKIAERDGQAQDKDIINSIKELNAMHGFNEPIKIDANISTDSELTINIVKAVKPVKTPGSDSED